MFKTIESYFIEKIDVDGANVTQKIVGFLMHYSDDSVPYYYLLKMISF